MALGESARAFNQRQLERSAKTCVHFNGVSIPGRWDDDSKQCKAGVCYRAHVGGERFGWLRRIPCTPSKPDDNPVPCPLFEATGMERAEAERRKWDEHFEKTTKALKAIKAHLRLDPPTTDCGGFIDCPVCSEPKSLSWSWASLNGHIWGKCSTKGCASWMQ